MRQLELSPRLLTDPAMWAAEIRDRVTGAIVWSSWAHDWHAYDTAEEAMRRATEMLPEAIAGRGTAA